MQEKLNTPCYLCGGVMVFLHSKVADAYYIKCQQCNIVFPTDFLRRKEEANK